MSDQMWKRSWLFSSPFTRLSTLQLNVHYRASWRTRSQSGSGNDQCYFSQSFVFSAMSLPEKWLDVNMNVWMWKFPLILASLRGNPTNTPPPHSHTVPLLLPVTNQRSSDVCPLFSIALVPLFTTYDKILIKHTSQSAAVMLVAKGA